MRENYRNSIASIKKFPQFTTMHVIDGQAGLIICASLIFCSLTIDNILNIIVLLLLAGISITMLTGNNGILTRAGQVKTITDEAQIEEKINLAYSTAFINGEGIVTEELLENELKKGFGKTQLDEGWLDKEAVEGKWKITIDGVASDVPAGLEINEKTITIHNLGSLGGTCTVELNRNIFNCFEGVDSYYDDWAWTEWVIEMNKTFGTSWPWKLFSDENKTVLALELEDYRDSCFAYLRYDYSFDNFPTDLYVEVD